MLHQGRGNPQQGCGRWEIPRVPAVWVELEVPAPGHGLLFSLPLENSIPQQLCTRSFSFWDWPRPSALGLS